MDKNEIDALIRLLEDPDEDIFKHIKGKILSLGSEVIPVLENAWENSFDHRMQVRIENIIHFIQYDTVNKQLTDWAKGGGKDLLAGVILVARYQYPDLNELKIMTHIERIKQDIWLELNNNLTALEKVRVLNHIIFDVHGFSGNTANFHAPQNSYINNVLESKKGNPLSLSVLYAIIAQRLDVNIYGVNLPEHFILAYVEDTHYLPIPTKKESTNVLFYINPFNRGSVFSKMEIDLFLKQLKLEPSAEYFEPCSNVDIVKRLIYNLIFSFKKLGYPDKVDEMKRLLNAL